MVSEREIRKFFDAEEAGYEGTRYSFMRTIRARAIKEEISQGLVLDIGCNCGHLITKYLTSQGLVGIDLSYNCLQFAKRKCRGYFINASANALPFKNKSFDCVLCSEVLYYLENPLVFLKNVYDKLKPGGKLVLLNSNQMYVKLGSIVGVWFRLRPADIVKRAFYIGEVIALLDKAGFINSQGRGVGVVPVKGLEALDKSFLNKLGFIHVVTGYRHE